MRGENNESSVDSGSNIEDDIIFRESFWAAFDELKPLDKLVLYMLIEGFGAKGIMQFGQVTESGARKRMLVARKRFREELRKKGIAL